MNWVTTQSFPLVVPGSLKRGHTHPPTSDVNYIVHMQLRCGINKKTKHVACPLAAPWAQFANGPPAGQLHFASPVTTNFTASSASYLSTGGDELNINCYTQTQQELAQQNKTLEQALDMFTQTTHGALGMKGKTPLVRSIQDLAKGCLIIVPSCASGIHRFSHHIRLTRSTPANLTDAQSKLIMGGEQLLWTEQSGPSNLGPIVWPRNVDTALPRLHDLSFRFLQRGGQSEEARKASYNFPDM
ncbi:N-acetylhexosaminidase [Amanita muscaria]